MKKVKVGFSDFWGEFDPTKDPIFGDFFIKNVNIEYDNINPDFLIFSVDGNKHKSYNCKKILFTPENFFCHSKDYVKAMHMILNHHTPDDFVVSTMETHSVRGMCDFLCDYLNIDKSCIKQDAKYLRAEELPYLKGDSTKIRNNVGWKPTYDFESLMKEMCDHWMSVLQGKKSIL